MGAAGVTDRSARRGTGFEEEKPRISVYHC